MSTYIYYEGCGYESEPFEAGSDGAAESHVMKAFRSPEDPDFDGDEGGIVRIDHDESGQPFRVRVMSFGGENMIEDPVNARQSYNGLGGGRD